MTPANKTILLVDDQVANLAILKLRLSKDGYNIKTAQGARECLDYLKTGTADVMLLDIMMPEIDGIELCTMLQKDEKAKHIPIYFVTAKTSQSTKLDCLAAGGLGFITKPVDLKEVSLQMKSILTFVEKIQTGVASEASHEVG